MDKVVQTMLDKYSCQNMNEYINALKEIMQEVALLGLWRGKFFEKAAFYGGTALRILYGLDRFSEDMGFSLLQPNPNFDLSIYNKCIEDELIAFGFAVTVERKVKIQESDIQSAFIKANTQTELLHINVPNTIYSPVPANQSIKIKLEVDTHPPLNFDTESKLLLLPIPFYVNTFTQPVLFAGKIHAVLCRKWKMRIKGRDWYDWAWMVGRGVPLHLKHLSARLSESGHIPKGTLVSKKYVEEALVTRIEDLDFERAKDDVLRYIKDKKIIELWSAEFFKDIVTRMEYT